MNMKFRDAVLALDARGVIELLIKSIESPMIELEMLSFGNVKYTTNPSNGVQAHCYGCAATNAICHIMNESIPADNIISITKRVNWLFGDESSNNNYIFVDRFEDAFDALRKGDLDNYNFNACTIGMAEIFIDDQFPFISRNKDVPNAVIRLREILEEHYPF
jgi:hypothetical protein